VTHEPETTETMREAPAPLTAAASARPAPTTGDRTRRAAVKALHFAAALFLFILAIQLMSKGAAAVSGDIRGKFPFANGLSTLGFGWLSAYIVLSGSPVAAVALNLHHANTINDLQTFTMLSGSRLGASFIVLLVGFLYAVRREGPRSRSIGMGVLALSLTALVYLPGMMIGYVLVKGGALSAIRWEASSELLSVIDLVWGPVVRLLAGSDGSGGLVPGAVLLPLGLAIILVSFKLLDTVLPEIDGERHAEQNAHWLRRPWPMFFLGCLAATLTLSVSVALTALVPLASKGHVTRREVIPYIMGANITTLADTLVAAMVLGDPVGVQIVLAEAIGVALVSLFILAFLYPPVSRSIIALDDWVVGTNLRLWLFVACLFVAPVFFLLSGLVLGPVTT
jgi:Na+/phosphate symporter